jgi:hypothetical protein
VAASLFFKVAEGKKHSLESALFLSGKGLCIAFMQPENKTR